MNGGLLSAQMTVTLTPAKDNTIYLSSQDDPLSNGAGRRIFAGRAGNGTLQRALMHFDIAGNIPAGAQIESVELTLTRVMVANEGNNRAVSLHRLEKDWGEGSSNAPMGQGGGTAPDDGDATWEHTFYDTEFWDTEGGDFVGSASASAQTALDVNKLTFASTGALVSDVQAWLDEPATNFGWIAIGDESVIQTANAFGSKDASNTGVQPQLVVQYSMSTSREQALRENFGFRLWPNPSRDLTTFDFTLNKSASVHLAIYNLLGKQVYATSAQTLPAGPQRLQWNGQNFAGKTADTGFYLYQLNIGSAAIGGRLLRMR